MTLVDLMVLVLGTSGMVETFRHDHRIQDKLAKLELLDEDNRWLFLRNVTRCGFCLSHWVAMFALAMWLFVPGGTVLVTLFALIRGANLVNDIFKKHNLSPERPDFDGNSIDPGHPNQTPSATDH